MVGEVLLAICQGPVRLHKQGNWVQSSNLCDDVSTYADRYIAPQCDVVFLVYRRLIANYYGVCVNDYGPRGDWANSPFKQQDIITLLNYFLQQLLAREYNGVF